MRMPTSSCNQSIDRIVDVHGIRFCEVRSISRSAAAGYSVRGDERRRTKLVRRTRNGSSPYFCDSSRPVHPSDGGSHYRSMDGRIGKGKRARSASVPPRLPRFPFSLSPSWHPFIPFSLSSSDPASLFFSRGSHRSLPLFYLPLPAPPRPSVFVI